MAKTRRQESFRETGGSIEHRIREIGQFAQGVVKVAEFADLSPENAQQRTITDTAQVSFHRIERGVAVDRGNRAREVGAARVPERPGSLRQPVPVAQHLGPGELAARDNARQLRGGFVRQQPRMLVRVKLFQPGGHS